MTRAATKPVVVEAGAVEGGGVEGGAWAVSVVWDVSALAGRRLADRLGRGGERVRGVELRVEPRGKARAGAGQAEAVLWGLLADGVRVELERADGVSGLWRREGGYEHVDVPGVVSWTARQGERGRPTYVRCAMLARCGVVAGAYSLRVGGE